MHVFVPSKKTIAERTDSNILMNKILLCRTDYGCRRDHHYTKEYHELWDSSRHNARILHSQHYLH